MHCANLRTDCTHGNPIVGARAWNYEHQLHLQRLKAVVANIDNKKPYMGNIEQQQKRPRKSYQQRSKEKMQAHENFKMLTTIAATMNRPCPVYPKPFPAHSLNISIRRKEHRRILRENKQMLERLERSKPLVATVDQYRQDFAEHERRLLLCSYSCRRNGGAHSSLALAVPGFAAKPLSDSATSRRQDADETAKQKIRIKCYKPGEAPHDTMMMSASHVSPAPKLPVAGKKQFDQRWKEFRCYPASRQMWAPPKVFSPKDLPKPIYATK